MQKPEWYTGNTSRFAEELRNLDSEKRLTILALKEELVSKNLYGVGKEFDSATVYEGVLSEQVTSIDELRQFIINSR